MITAHFIVGDEEREVREVTEDWLHGAEANHENVLLSDGNNYLVLKVSVDGAHARVELVPPEFARAS